MVAQDLNAPSVTLYIISIKLLCLSIQIRGRRQYMFVVSSLIKLWASGGHTTRLLDPLYSVHALL